MKTIQSIATKVVFVIVLSATVSTVLNLTPVSTVSEAKAATYQEVYTYLTTRGYEVITLGPASGTKCNWLAHTVKAGVHYWTTVYCNCSTGAIVGHADEIYP